MATSYQLLPSSSCSTTQLRGRRRFSLAPSTSGRVATRLVVPAAGADAARTRVVAVGEALFDLIADQKGVPRNKVKSWTPFAGGAPANVATSLAKLGMDVVFVSALGKDERGDQLYDLLKSCSVKLHAVQRCDTRPTRDVYVTRDANGDREFAGFGLDTKEYCDAFLDEKQLPLDDIKGAAVLVTGTLGLAYPATRAAMRKAVAAAKEGGCKVMVDVNWRPVFWDDPDAARKEVMDFLQQADLIKVSDADIKWLLGMSLSTALINPCAINQSFPAARGVLLTAGDEGAAYCFKGEGGADSSGFVRTFQVKVVDTTGAGDAFAAGFLYEMLQAGGLDAMAGNAHRLKEAVVFASAAGALTCTRKGAIEGQPKLEEVEELFNTSKSWYNFW